MIIIENTLARYVNGGYRVTLWRDGRKERVRLSDCPPEMPESIDLKITNKCMIGCKFCHEASTPNGEHAPMERVESLIKNMRPGTEIAIGGGDPMLHPRLEEIISMARKAGMVPNITVRIDSLTERNIERLRMMQDCWILFGIGVSGAQSLMMAVALKLKGLDNLVMHSIVAVDRIWDVIEVARDADVLVLGYKNVGRGKTFFKNKEFIQKLEKWKYFTPTLLQANKKILAFDNMAIEQLEIDKIIERQEYDAHYMGDEGEFTMYYDAVADKFAVSSASKRIERNGRTIKEMFDYIREHAYGACDRTRKAAA